MAAPTQTQTGFKTYLLEFLDATATECLLATAPSITSGRIMFQKGNIVEWASFSGRTDNLITGMVRGLSQTAYPATAGVGKDWSSGTPVIMVFMHDELIDKTSPIPIIGITTTVRDALDMSGAYYNGTKPIIYNTTTGQNEQWTGSGWTAFATGTVANASATVAGKVEIATSAESIAGTDTGGTGALLSVLPSDIKTNLNAAILLAQPTGAVTMYAGSTAPTGWLLCDASAVSRTTYATLFAVISTTYGAGDGSTTFNVPDFRGRVPVGVGTGTGGGASGTGTPTGGSALTAVARGGWKGEETHTMTSGELVGHTHTVQTVSGAAGVNNGVQPVSNLATTGTVTTSSTGSATPFNVLQPEMGVNFIIKT